MKPIEIDLNRVKNFLFKPYPFLLLILGWLCSSNMVNAQSEVLIAIKGGVNYNTLRVKNNSEPISQDWLLSYHGGVVVDLMINQLFSLRTGIDLQTRGGSYETVLEKNGKLNAMYLELPVNFLMKKDFQQLSIYLGAGPFIDYGIGGKNKYSVLTREGEEISESIHWAEDEPAFVQAGKSGYLKRFLYGANAVGGVVFSGKVGLNLQYSYGLAQAQPQQGDRQFRSLHAGLILFL